VTKLHLAPLLLLAGNVAAIAVTRAVDEPGPSWSCEVNYLRWQGDSFVTVTSDQASFREERYFASAEDQQAQRFRKRRVYRLDGTLAYENDRVADDQYDRAFYADGTLRYFDHWQAGRWLAGYGFSPEHKTYTGFADGNGVFTEWGDDEATYVRQWYRDGAIYLIVRVDGGVVVETGRFSTPAAPAATMIDE
jgi:hypothetical protein